MPIRRTIALMLQRALYTVQNLEEMRRFSISNEKIISLRKGMEILLIDDDEFPLLRALQQRGFRIVQWDDIQAIETVARYPIILCDLNGIGRSLAPDLQGAAVIREIKANYPDKVVIAYTGGGPSLMTEQAYQDADLRLRKDVGVEDWKEKLDEAIRLRTNPSEVWKKTRPRLLEEGITPIQLAILEDAFVEAAINQKQIDSTGFDLMFPKAMIPAEVKKLFVDVVSSTIVKMIGV